ASWATVPACLITRSGGGRWCLRETEVIETYEPTSLHRQLLYVTSFVFIGYYLLKRQDYMYAVKDRDMFAYVKSHPEDFPEKDKKTYGEFLEEFHPVR
uniref:NADH:ubiquinone oxidoreductase subunit C2 n=1 Tax=Ursus maritimus TaxID=29073 RepID=A0A452U4B0_URSMA